MTRKKQHQCSLTVTYNSFNVGLVKFHSGWASALNKLIRRL